MSSVACSSTCCVPFGSSKRIVRSRTPGCASAGTVIVIQNDWFSRGPDCALSLADTSGSGTSPGTCPTPSSSSVGVSIVACHCGTYPTRRTRTSQPTAPVTVQPTCERRWPAIGQAGLERHVAIAGGQQRQRATGLPPEMSDTHVGATFPANTRHRCSGWSFTAATSGPDCCVCADSAGSTGLGSTARARLDTAAHTANAIAIGWFMRALSADNCRMMLGYLVGHCDMPVGAGKAEWKGQSLPSRDPRALGRRLPCHVQVGE